MTPTEKRLAEIRSRVDAAPDCGDNSCLFRTKKGGMRTNGGCHCIDKRSMIHWSSVEKFAAQTSRDIPHLLDLLSLRDKQLERAIDSLRIISVEASEKGFRTKIYTKEAREALAEIEAMEKELKSEDKL